MQLPGLLDIDNVLFSVAGQNVSVIEFLSVISGLLCVYLATRSKSMNFWVGYLYNILLFMLFMQKHLYSSMLLQPVSLAINFFGHYRWTHPAKGEENNRKQLRVSLLSAGARAVTMLVIAVASVVWGYALSRLSIFDPEHFPPATRPFLDAFVTMLILAAQYLAAQKKMECWAVWFVVNIMNITLYILAGLVFMPVVGFGYLILAISGFRMWRTAYRNHN